MFSAEQPAQSRFRAGFRQLPALVLYGFLALFTIDVLVNLRLIKQAVLGDLIASGWRDFVGLMQAEIPVAVLCAAASAAGGALLAAVGRSAPWGESPRLMSAALAVLAVLSGLKNGWRFAMDRLGTGVALAVAAGVVVWLALRLRALRPGARSRPEWGDSFNAILFPPLAFASVILTASEINRGEGGALPAAGVTLLVLGLATGAYRARRAAVRWGFRCGPLFMAAMISAFACASPTFRARIPDGSSPASGEGRPHIVLIVLDTVRADHLMRYGHFRNTMPHLERWADGALTVRLAISPAGWTSPAHASILSGRTVSLHGVHYSSTPSGFSTSAYAGVPWLPALLAAEGFQSAAFVANFLAVPPEVEGFETLIAPSRQPWEGSTIAALVEHHSGVRNHLSERLRWRLPYADARQMVDIILRTAPRPARPVFLMVNLLDAHAPYNPPRSALDELGVTGASPVSKYLQNHELTLAWTSLPDSMTGVLSDLYDGELRWMDTHLARLLNWVDEWFGSDTLVVVTSDHGEELGERGRVGHEFGLSQSLIHVPLFLRGPGIKAGTMEGPVTLRSLYNLVLAYGRGERAGASLLEETDEFGVLSERYPSGENTRLLGKSYERAWVALIQGGTKGVGPSADGFQAFALGPDGHEREIEPGTGGSDDALRDRIDSYWQTYRDRREDADSAVPPSEELLRKLRALGYVQ